MSFLTIKDIARLAQVSHTTVSRVLNNKPGVRQATKDRILNLVRELNYQPNLVARSLVMKRSRTLGMVITSIRNPFYLELAQGIEHTARSLGYSVFLCCTNFDLSREEEHVKELRRKGVDGIILSSAHVKDPYVAALVEEGFPLVLVNRRIVEPDLSGKMDYIGVDNVRGAEMAVEHLLQMGRYPIGIITGIKESSVTLERLEGVRTALEKHGLAVDDSFFFEGDYLKGSGYEGARYFLSRTDPPNAIFAFNDYMALGVYDALLKRKVKVPEDISVIGFNDIEFASSDMVSLSTISQKKHVLGSMAVRRLIDRIEGAAPGMQQILEPELIVRRSSDYVVREPDIQSYQRSRRGE